MSLMKNSSVIIQKCLKSKQQNLVWKRCESFWGGVEMGPPDEIFGLTEAWKVDKNPKKVNLGAGAYRDDDGKPYVLPSIRKAEEKIYKKKMNHEYPPIDGVPEFRKVAAEMAFGEKSCVLENKLNMTVQALSGTGALNLGALFLNKFHSGCKVIFFPKPTWGNHQRIFKHAGIDFKFYRYYDPKTRGLDFCGMKEDIANIPEKSVILFHAIAHNPTGVDPSKDNWKELSHICKERKLLVFFDMAYQGFATGDLENDAFAMRHFVEEGHKIMLAQSFAKNMGLYGERAGTLTILTGHEDGEVFRNRKGYFSINTQVICDHNLNIMDIVARWPGSAHDMTIFNNSHIRTRFEAGEFPDSILLGSKEEQTKLLSQMKIIIRGQFSNPPLFGARLVTEILTDNSLKCQWIKDVKGMADRIMGARKMLVEKLKTAGSQHNWDHITNQIGMFCYTGLAKDQVKKLVKDYSIYMTADGRISVAGVGSKNVEYLAKSMHEVTK